MRALKLLSNYLNIFLDGKNTVSVDMGHRYTKVLHAVKDNGRAVLKRLVVERTPSDMFTHQGIDTSIASEFLISLLEQNHIKAGWINLSIGKPYAMVRILTVPSSDKRNADVIIRERLKENALFELDSMEMDYQVYDMQDDNSIIVVALTRKDVLNSYVETVQKNMMRVASITTDGLSSLNAFISSVNPTDSETYVFVNGGYTSSDVFVTIGHIPVYYRSIDFGAEEIMRMVGDYEGMSLDDVESMLINGNQKAVKSDVIADTMHDALSNFIKHVVNTVDDYTYDKNVSIENIFVAGGVGQLLLNTDYRVYTDEYSDNHYNIYTLDMFSGLSGADNVDNNSQLLFASSFGQVLKTFLQDDNG